MRNGRPVIGITTDIDDASNLCSVNREYGEAIWHAGGMPLLIEPVSSSSSYVSAVLAGVDGVVLSGGGDIDPSFYGQTLRASLLEAHPRRDAFEKALVKQAHAADFPILGICRGMQMMNVALGGTLIQDIPAACISEEPGTHQQSKPYEKPSHEVEIVENTLLARLCQSRKAPHESTRAHSQDGQHPYPSLATSRAQSGGTTEPYGFEGGRAVFVNSMHHQAINRVASELTASAFCYKVIEGIEDAHKTFFLGVQWHPEYLVEGGVLFEALCRAAYDFRRKNPL